MQLLLQVRAMNRLPLARRSQVINCLVEGNSIRSTERMTDTHSDTIMRLLVQVGDGCARIMDERMRALPCQRIQVDEIWSYVHKKQRWVTPEDDRSRVGDIANINSARFWHAAKVNIHIHRQVSFAETVAASYGDEEGDE